MGGGTKAELTQHGEQCDGICCGLGIADVAGQVGIDEMTATKCRHLPASNIEVDNTYRAHLKLLCIKEVR